VPYTRTALAPGGAPRAHLSFDAERRLVCAAAGGDRQAREELVDVFLPLIGGVARGYRGVAGIESKELMQEGVVGLLRALKRYDAAIGAPFWPYASWWVRQAMQKLVAELRRSFVLSDRALRQLARVKDAQLKRLQADGCEPSTAELSEATGFTPDHVRALVAAERAPRALEEPIGRGDDAGRVGDLVSDPCAEDAFDRIVNQLASESLRELPDDLGERERTILAARYGLGRPPQTLREVARELGISAERVRQIEEQALAKLRETFVLTSVEPHVSA
jgi:RNA polymerase sigma factor (sigma-70 family)